MAGLFFYQIIIWLFDYVFICCKFVLWFERQKTFKDIMPL